MRMDRLTTQFQLALSDAQSLALRRDHASMEPPHVLVALLDQQGGSVRHLLTRADADVPRLRSRLGELLDRAPTVRGNAGNVADRQRPRPLSESVRQARRAAGRSVHLQRAVPACGPGSGGGLRTMP